MVVGTRKLRDVLGPRRPVEFLVRNVLFLGFFVLLLLVASLGYRSVKSVEALEKDSTRVDETEERHLRLVLDLKETAGKVAAEVRNVVGNSNNERLKFPAQQRLNELKKEMDREVDEARRSSLVETEEWAAFETTYREFWEEMARSDSATNGWHEAREKLLKSVKQLEQLVDKEREENNLKAHEMSVGARNRIVAATGTVLTVGMVVALLAFFEIRKSLKKLAGAHVATAESRDYLQSLLDSLVSGVVVIGSNGAVQTVSESFRKMPGVVGVSETGQSYEELFSTNPSLLAAVAEEFAEPTTSSRYYGRVDLGTQLFDFYTSPLLIAGERHGIILVFVDVTDATRAQQELQRNSALTAVGQMTAQIAHEIKNPLGSIGFAAEILKRRGGGIDPEDRTTIAVIERSVGHLAAIVAQLSEFARPKQLNLEEVNLNELLDGLLPMVADRLSTKDMQITRQYDLDLPIGYYDGTELRKLFLNLIINAIEASEPQSSVELRTSLDGEGRLSIEIADHGCGMDADTQRRLFEPFYTTKEKGTGLGMAIALQIAELHGGALSVRSKPGVGTTATVHLPLTKFVEADNRTGAVSRLSR